MGKSEDYQHMYEKHPRTFLKTLINNVIQGQDQEKETLAQLLVLDNSQKGKNFIRNLCDKDDTILNLAAKFDKGSKVLKAILDICPVLLYVSRQEAYEGQTTLHIVICKKNVKAIACLFETCAHEDYSTDKLLRRVATGSRFTNTVMMGELPFSVAALTLDLEIVRIMYNYGSPDMVSFQNSYGDTVFHSLIKYACLQPKKVDEIIAVCIEINSYLFKRRDYDFNIDDQNLRLDQTDPMAVWFLQNYNAQTPLQLAASLEQVELFEYIINIQNVYCCLDRHDGLFDVHLYDITEIDTVPMTEKKLDKSKKSTVSPKNTGVEVSPMKVNDKCTRFKNERAELKQKRGKPILETMCEIDVQKAFKLIKMLVMTSIIKAKWSRYQWIYYVWAVFHFIYMCTLTYYAVIKTEDVNQRLSGNNDAESGTNEPKTFYQCVYTCVQSMNSQPDPNTTNQQDAIASTNKNYELLIIIPSTNIFIAVLILIFEIIRRSKGYKYHIRQIHHNGTYRIILCTFSVCLIIDSVWYLITPNNNYFLIMAILIGWWFLTFFLRAFKKFSFFTVMLQKVIHGDGFRFFVIIVIEFLSFTMAMYVTFLDTKPEEFQTVWQSALTMFNLMLGLSELNVLMQAREPWLACVLYVLFILLTYVLMLNALIAMMSQTCSEISANKKVQGELQRLSVIIFLESVLPHRFKVCCGNVKIVKHFDFYTQKIVIEKRYYLEIASLQPKYIKGSAILTRRKIVQTMKFDSDEFYEHSILQSRDTSNTSRKVRYSGENINEVFPPLGRGSSPDRRNPKRKSSKRRKSAMNEDNKDVTDGLHISNVTPAQSASASVSMGDQNPEIT